VVIILLPSVFSHDSQGICENGQDNQHVKADTQDMSCLFTIVNRF